MGQSAAQSSIRGTDVKGKQAYYPAEARRITPARHHPVSQTLVARRTGGHRAAVSAKLVPTKAAAMRSWLARRGQRSP
jgi:hypothetical protein